MIDQEPKSLQALLLAIYLLISISKLAFLTSAIFLLAHHQTYEMNHINTVGLNVEYASQWLA